MNLLRLTRDPFAEVNKAFKLGSDLALFNGNRPDFDDSGAALRVKTGRLDIQNHMPRIRFTHL